MSDEEAITRINMSVLDGKQYPRLKIWGGERRYLCEKCGTWTCNRCGKKRNRMNRSFTGVHRCTKCGGTTGTWGVSYHSPEMWAKHYGHVPLKGWATRVQKTLPAPQSPGKKAGKRAGSKKNGGK